MRHDPLRAEETRGLADILLRRIAVRFGVGPATFSAAAFVRLWPLFLRRVVRRGRWRLPEALAFADRWVAKYLARRAS